MSHTPTDEQQTAIEATRRGGSLILSAYAGCAKSSTLEMMAPEVKEPALALAFNKRIAQDIQQRLPGNFTAKTLNSLGHSAWIRGQNLQRVKIDERKIGNLITQIGKESKTRLSSEQWTWSRQLTEKAMQEGLRSSRWKDRLEGAELMADTEENWQSLAGEVGVPSEDVPIVLDIAREALLRGTELALQGQMSFDDQIYCPIVLGGAWPKFPTIFVDESQDLSRMNHLMIQQCLRNGGRLAVVGDELQAIYAWRGADSQSMKSMRSLSDGWTDLPLTLTFRCPKEVVLRQQSHAKGFRAAAGNREGTVENWKAVGWDSDKLGQLSALQDADPRSTAVLCRNNGPLLSLAFKLLRRQIGCWMLGRDLGKGLTALSKKIAPEDGTPADRLHGLITEWEARECQMAAASGREHLVEGIEDRAQCLIAVLDSGATDAGALRALLADLFARNGGQITLSSIHRAKGLEWDTVLHLDPWRIPSKWAKKAAAQGDSRALVQEWNLNYVAETRTRNVLVLANLEDFQ